MRGKCLILLLAIAAFSSVYAADVVQKYSGPSGQGSVIWWAPSTGITNMEMTTAGLKSLAIVNGSIAPADITLASGKIIVGGASGTGAAVSVSGDVVIDNTGKVTVVSVSTNAGGAGTLTGILKATSGVVAPAVANIDFAAPANIAVAPALSTNSGTTEIAVTIQTRTLAAGNMSGQRLIRVWVSDTNFGAPSTNNIEGLTLSTGTAMQTVVAKADYWYLTASDGSAIATIASTADGTNYLMVADGGYVSSVALSFSGH